VKLKSFRVERFRNILDSGSVDVDSVVICLVGKNESGKTNLLQSLEALNPALRDREFDTQQYPRWLEKEHQRTGELAAARPISATFELSQEEMAGLASQFGEDFITKAEWTVAVGYDNARHYSIDVDEEAACRHFEASMGTDTGATKITALKGELAKRAAATEANAEGAQVPTAAAQKAQQARAELDRRFPGSPSQAATDYVAGRMPRFFYFDDYSQLQGRTPIEPLIEALRTNATSSLDRSQRTALALLQLGFAGEDLVATDYERRSGEMEAVAADLTRQVQKYWHQNDHLRLRIDIEPVEEQRADGTHIVNRFLQLRVEDTRHFFTNNFDVRSSGFRWFVSFLAAFAEFESDHSMVVLLDEPALALHARAQDDFLRFIEERLAQNHQVIYTTHSPFMVDAAHLERVRVVEDLGPEEGAIVKAQLMSRDPDTLSPLQGALGYDIAQNIFVGPDNLVVEGLSDYTYLSVMSEILRSLSREYLDPRWRLLPAGGAGTMPAAVSLLGQQLDVTVVVDGGSRPPQKLNALVSEGVLDAKRIIMLGPIAGLKSADIEDLFDPSDYLSFYNGALSGTLTVASLAPPGDRIVSQIAKTAGSFNHNDPANWFLANRTSVTPSLRATSLDRFEDAIRQINATLT